MRFILAALCDEERPLSRLAAAEVLGRVQLTSDQLPDVLKALADNAVVSPSVVVPALLRATSPTTSAGVQGYLEQALRKGWRPNRQELDAATVALRAAGAKAGDLEEIVQEVAGRQQHRLGEFEPLLQGGDVTRGRGVFLGKKVACATCHRIGTDGGAVGPDLTKVGAVRSGRDLLESILVPSSTIAQGYDAYVVVTDAGKALHGLIARQTADLVVLRDAAGAELQLRKDRIQEVRRSAVSIMPEGLERALSRDEFRDLLAFLQSLK